MDRKVFGLMTTNSKMPDYVAGSCNIGGPEVQRRKMAGYFGLLVSVATLFFFFIVQPASGFRVLIFFPLLLSSISWYQTRNRFCLAFGLAGTFNFGALGSLAKVSNPEDLRADRTKAFGMLLKAVAVAAIGTGIVIFLPF